MSEKSLWKFVDVTLNLQSQFEDFQTHLLAVCKPEWVDKPLKIKIFADGLTNKLMGVYPVDGDFDQMVLVRINGNGTEKFIRRDWELCTMVTLHKAGLNPPVYCQFSNGICYGYQPGRMITLDEMADLKMARYTAKCFAALHNTPIPVEFPCSNRLFEFYDYWLDIIDDFNNDKRFNETFGSKEALRREATEMKRVIEELNSPLVFSHNDTLSGNIIFNNKANKVSLIDFEYGGPNVTAFDIGNHFTEFAGIELSKIDYKRYPDEELQKKWIKMYLEEVAILNGKQTDTVTNEQVQEFYRQVGKCALASHLCWAIWGLVQAQNATIEFEYMEYAMIRYNEYLRRKQSFLTL